jgi:hypothetical protein
LGKSHEAAGIHRASRRRGDSMAVRGAFPAVSDAGDRVPAQHVACGVHAHDRYRIKSANEPHERVSAAKKYRVIAFDRPGFGHSERPRNTTWTPEAQADLIATAIKKIGVPRAIILGHLGERWWLSLLP